MKTINTMLLAGFLVLSFVSTANAGKPLPVELVNCDYFGSSGNVCTTDLAALCDAIDGAGSLKDRDRNTMVSKTIGADIKLEQDKESEADAKLHRIETKLNSLPNVDKPSKSKISGADFVVIDSALSVAQICVDIVYPHTD